ncbi:ty1-copia retrotransposon protein [Cucumis melo var. makuwa]|uniref:Ty1-copia retrotransposon protein n=1 Tax=Cucumis melo var. makuwa TaxID=1194695 RepID=A0A5D3DTL3_CUCMM|nr:ty1-copia retrotransposon protein [Cucumis melo var. makuwa]TYK26844.1 ty1-copia retrotransposon protein [Cucumis melo var. makuwa]
MDIYSQRFKDDIKLTVLTLRSCVNLRKQPALRLAPQSAKIAFRAVLEVDYILATDLPSNPLATTPAPSDPESSTGPYVAATDQVKKDQMINFEKYEKDNKTVRGHLLNHISDPLFVAQKSAKDIWSTLKSWYGGDDSGRKNMLLENGYSSR